MNAVISSSQREMSAPAIDPRARSHAVVLGFLLVFACLSWNIPFGGTFAVALVASFTLSAAPRWWRALVGCVALAGFLFGVAYTSYLLIAD